MSNLNSYKTPNLNIKDYDTFITNCCNGTIYIGDIIQSILKLVYFNKEHPENYSILASNKLDGKIYVYDENKWQHINFSFVIDKIYEKWRDIFKKYSTDNKHIKYNIEVYSNKIHYFYEFDVIENSLNCISSYTKDILSYYGKNKIQDIINCHSDTLDECNKISPKDFVIETFKNKQIMYLIYIPDENNTFKFGKTSNIETRLKQLTYSIKKEIIPIKCWDCKFAEVSSESETRFKYYARYNNILCKKYGLTEIITTNNIELIIETIDNLVKDSYDKFIMKSRINFAGNF
jgi:hypothetical protein